MPIVSLNTGYHSGTCPPIAAISSQSLNRVHQLVRHAIGCPKKYFFRLCKLINWPVVLPRANNKHAKFHRDSLRFGPPRPLKDGDPLP